MSGAKQNSLFALKEHAPLAEQMRPDELKEYIGQNHLLASDKPLAIAIKQQQPFSMLLWGPPGCGKTTLALLLAKSFKVEFIRLSAVFSGVKDVREAVAQAKNNLEIGLQTVLFIDEIHRFNKAQQDAFLPYVEAGDIILIGATTENPAFHLTNALLSRLRIFRLYALSSDEIKQTLQKALSKFSLKMSEASLQLISSHASGDARKALSWLDEWLLLHKQGIEEAKALAQVLADQPKAMDKNGDWFYEMLSAFHKSLRGSNVDGAMYWFARMIDAGMDALIIARRMLCVASEDIGNADPNALNLALNAYMTYERLGSPEGHLALAQALTYLALAPKSNASYHAMNEAFAYVRNHPSYSVPNHLRNAPTALHQIQGYGKGYRYAHHEPNAYAAGQTYLPKEMLDKHNQPKVSFYQPNERGFEIKLANKLRYLQELDLQTQNYK